MIMSNKMINAPSGQKVGNTEAIKITSRPVGAKQLTIMRKTFLLLSLVFFTLQTIYAQQIDPSIPTPQDLAALKDNIKVITKERLPDGTIVIRYVDKQGRTMQRRTHPSKPNEKQEWDEANPPQKIADPKTGLGAARVDTSTILRGAPEGFPDTTIKGSLVNPWPTPLPPPPSPSAPPPPITGLGAARVDTSTIFRGAPGGFPDTSIRGSLANPFPPPSPKPTPAPSPIDDVKKGAAGAIPTAPQPATPTSALDEAAKAAKEILEEFLKAISNLFVIKATGTGNTIGNIANITVTNTNDFPVEIQPQTFFIPSDGKYQRYVGRIPKGIIVPPDGTVVIPVDGVCADVHTPPVSSDEDMPPVYTWIPVGNSPQTTTVSSNPTGTSDQTNPQGENTTHTDIMLIPIVSTPPVPEFKPTDIPNIMTTSGYKMENNPDPEIIITWPGTDIPTGGTLDPGINPEVYAPVIVSMLESIEVAAGIVRESGIFPTPFSKDSSREEKAFIQQTFWIASAALTGNEYTKTDFTKITYDQFQQSTGKTVASLPPEQKEQVDSGIADFWNTFQVTGVVAKVISAESPGVDIEIPNSLLQDAEAAMTDKFQVNTDNTGDSEEDLDFKCDCPNDIEYTLEIKRGAIIEYGHSFESDTTELELLVMIIELRFGDTLDIKARDIKVNCLCAETRCDVLNNFYPIQFNNCKEIDRNLKENSVRIEISPNNVKDKTISFRVVIAADCYARGCNLSTCIYPIKLTFVDNTSKK